MYNLDTIQKHFFTNKVVTFKNDLDANLNGLETDLKGTSLTKKYFNVDSHPYVNYKNINFLAPYFTDEATDFLTIYTTWSNATTYAQYDTVKHNSVVYEALQAGLNKEPGVETTYWKSITQLDIWLKDKIKGAIEQVLSELGWVNPLLEHTKLYRISNYTDDQITGEDKWVGLRLYPKKSTNIKIILNQLGTQFTAAETITFKLYNQNTQVSTFDVTTLAGDFSWNDLTDIEISDKQGPWYLFYDQTGMTGKAIGQNTLLSTQFYPYVDVVGFKCTVDTDLNSITVSDFDYTSNFGLNLNLSVEPDLTDFYKKHIRLLGEPVKLQFAKEMLGQFLSNSEAKSNLYQRNINDELIDFQLTSLEGNTVAARYIKEIDKLKKVYDKLGFNDWAFKKDEKIRFRLNAL